MDHLVHWTCFLGIILTSCHTIHGLESAVTDERGGEIDNIETNPVLGKFTPVPNVEITNRACDFESLARVQDERFCNKYYVCSADRYVSLFCPMGMAFDYSQQNCRIQPIVDCSNRPLIASATESVSEPLSRSKATEPHKTTPILTTPAPTPTPSVTTLTPTTTIASDPAPFSTPTTATTSPQRGRAGMKLSRGRKVQKEGKVTAQPVRSNNRNSSPNQDRSENKSIRVGGGDLSRGKSLSGGSSSEPQRHRFNIARAMALKAAKAANKPVTIGDAAPLSQERDDSVTTTVAPTKIEIDADSSEESEESEESDEDDLSDEQILPALVNSTFT